MLKIGNLEVYGVIYKVENIINNKIYIGQTTQGFNKRYGYNLKRSTTNKHLKSAIVKYGIENFEIVKIFDIAFSQIELDIKESAWIDYYDCINNGYNNKTGGNGGCHYGEEVKIKMSKAKKGKYDGINNPNYGNHKLAGKNNPRYGKHLNFEQKAKISATHKGKKLTDEHIEKIRKGSINNVNVYCLTTGMKFNSAQDAMRFYGICSSSGIISCCKGKRKSYGNLNGKKLIWKYYDEYLKESV
ncbi:hypothetical protein FDB42_02000 [Clostridium botulinum]|nr:hypothetical protein [Clostridium botulinum]